MFKQIWLFFLFLFLVSPSLGYVGAIEVKLLNGGKKELDAGSNFNLLLNINNTSDSTKSLQVLFLSKDSVFKALMDYSSLKIDKGSNINKIIGIQIPSYCRSGDYTLQVKIVDNAQRVDLGLFDVKVLVKPKFAFNIVRGSAPKFVLSGDTLTLNSTIQNLSNQDITVKATAIDDGSVKNEVLHIPQGGNATFRYFSKIPSNVTNYARRLVVINAVIQEMDSVNQSTSFTFDVFPGKDVKFDRYNRLPIRISGMMVGTNRWGGYRYSTMYDISGSGLFGVKKDRMLNFTFRGPNRAGDPLLGQEESYSLRYSTKKLAVSFGDDNFGLSELTESSRGGRGVKLMYKLGKYTFGGFYNHPKYYPLIKETFSAYGTFDINQNNNLNIGFLNKVDTLNRQVSTYSASARISLFSWLNSNVEYALGQQAGIFTKAYKGAATVQFKGFSTYFNFLYTDPKFVGYMSNSYRLNGGLSASLKNIFITTNANINRTNSALDTLFANLPYSENYNLSLGYKVSKNSMLSLGAFMNSVEDLGPVPLFNYSNYSARLSLQSTIGSFRLGLNGDYGKTINKLQANQADLRLNASFNSSYELSSKFTINAYSNYMGGQRGISGYDQFYYGGSCLYRKEDRFSVMLNYNSNFEWQYYTSDRSLVTLNVTAKPFKNHEVSLSFNRNLKKNTLNAKEFNLQLRYVYLLNLPVSIRKDVGSVSGKLINNGVAKVNGVRLNINGNVVLTDKDGNFKFPGVPVGLAILTVDASSLGINAILETPGPYKINIMPGKTSVLNLPVTQSASIKGRFVVKEDDRANQRGYVAIKDPMGRLVVEVSDSSEIFRVYSDDEGNFRFNDLRPSTWKVKVYTNGLSQGYQIETTEYQMTLGPGDAKSMEVPVSKKARQIQFQRTTKQQ